MKGALGEKLASVATELENQRRVVERLEDERKKDHDLQVKHGEWIDTIFRRVEKVEKDREEEAKAQALEAKEASKEHKEEHKEKGSRWWQLWLAIIGAFLAALLGAAVTKLF